MPGRKDRRLEIGAADNVSIVGNFRELFRAIA